MALFPLWSVILSCIALKTKAAYIVPFLVGVSYSHALHPKSRRQSRCLSLSGFVSSMYSLCTQGGSPVVFHSIFHGCSHFSSDGVNVCGEIPAAVPGHGQLSIIGDQAVRGRCDVAIPLHASDEIRTRKKHNARIFHQEFMMIS